MTYTISIGTLNVEVRSERAHETGQEKTILVKVDWRLLHQAWTAAKVYTLARLCDFLVWYDARLTEKQKQYITEWPPHSLFCEKRCCQRAFSSYWRHLKKEVKWGADGHII